MAIFVTYSRPEPNPVLEAKVREQLKSIDSLLDIKWLPTAIWNEAQGTMEGRYCLACDWPIGDPRWELFASGEIQEHFDMLGWFCTDIHDANSIPVDIDSIENKVIELLAKCDNTRIHWKDRMKEIVEKNAKLRRTRKQDILDQTHDVTSTLRQAVGRHEESQVQRIMDEIAQGAR